MQTASTIDATTLTSAFPIPRYGERAAAGEVLRRLTIVKAQRVNERDARGLCRVSGLVIDGSEQAVRVVKGLGRCALALVCLPVVLLTGCPQQQTAASSAPAKATAPPIAVPAQSAAPASTSAQSVEASATTVK